MHVVLGDAAMGFWQASNQQREIQCLTMQEQHPWLSQFFGGTSQPAPFGQAGAFGQPPPAPSPFGQPAQATAPFGQQPGQAQGGLFGQPAQPSTNPFGTQAGAGAFGAHAAAGGPFGAPAAPSPFGQPAAQPGAPAPFGQPVAPPAGGMLFGKPAGAAAAPSPFGQPAQPFGQPPGTVGSSFSVGDADAARVHDLQGGCMAGFEAHRIYPYVPGGFCTCCATLACSSAHSTWLP